MRKEILTIKKARLITVVLITVFLVSNIVNAQAGGTSPIDSTSSGGTNTIKDPSINSTKTTINPDYQNINSSKFRLVICDGPVLPDNHPNKIPGYIPCDFQGLMLQLQHLIDIAIIAGVLIAIIGFTYAGFLYVTGVPGNINKAHKIFPAVMWGFIIMLSAWFVIYQILEWLTGSRGFGVLLGS